MCRETYLVNDLTYSIDIYTAKHPQEYQGDQRGYQEN